MDLAYDYPVLGAFWTILFIVAAVAWLFLLVRVIADVFQDHQMSGLGKTAWLVCVLCLPFLGVFLYLIVRGSQMSARAARQDAELRGATASAARTQPAHDTTAEMDELARLADLKAHGDISEAEYEREKDRILH
ncbi:SHOCT domain-containing protein [Actinacidiphila acidipaludis]|uniref:SHOCT domain-containing protein n=1 Tax=Actinacidiphila acidipaludis TaxID=2873382 RepID=A0ABS7Q0C6_9ACTN|nr:SHOCT domain-containing protein [Streptomyces acidipaludis]MBY8876346.1 SHOCT domain-containing protein [Streptomyces acidipaludis]